MRLGSNSSFSAVCLLLSLFTELKKQVSCSLYFPIIAKKDIKTN
jgi:hypothetical protein